jgi:DNA-binding MarR family transcriptional regulator
MSTYHERAARQVEAMRLYGRAMGIVDPLRVRAWSEAELTTSQLRLLFLLREEPGATLGALAGHLRVSAPTASGVVDRLVRQGFARREEDARDRRLVRHFLTEQGEPIVSELEREGRALMHEILGRLSPDELEMLIRGLELLTKASDETTDIAGASAR